ncbi:ABC-three component system protein [Streptococcus equi]|uniref:ABC-three component system protein n=1 Tax=Streptococcus equi TaxID=1336 RepID=UPI0013F60C52|nr:ABC-three component system protein [Streptococcus equi]
MQEFNISSFLKLLHPSIPTLAQGSLGILVLNSIATRDDVLVNIDDKKVSRLINRKIEIDEAIKTASAHQQTTIDVIEYFKNEICPLLNPHNKNDAFLNILHCINNDTSVPAKKYSELNSFLEHDDEVSFLGYAFLYSINRVNKLNNSALTTDDIPLLEEVNNECPICHRKLVRNQKNKLHRNYEIVKIFPDNLSPNEENLFKASLDIPANLNEPSNKIPLCISHASQYLVAPDLDVSIELAQKKMNGIKILQNRESLSEVGLETQIKEIIDALENLTPTGQYTPLNMSALKIEQKIHSDNLLLRSSIQFSVLTYFMYIKSLFTEISEFQLIQSDIRRAFLRLDNSGLSQVEIVEELSHWILNKTNMDFSHLEASKIIVAYFIQNCEVFNEITE